MNTNALIEETLKYLEKNENGQPKYRFDIYKKGISDTISKLTLGKVDAGAGDLIEELRIDENEAVPVTIYTIGDIFSTIQQTTGEILENISALPDTLENINVSLRQLGFNSLGTAINAIKAAVVPIEVIQKVNDVYRIARPLVEKVVDIASIMFHFENAAKVAQDVLQYIGRLAVSTAKNALVRLFEIFLDTPIFAIYENNETVNLAGTYSFLSDAAEQMLNGLITSEDAFSDVINYVNTASDTKMYEPGYSSLGIAVSEDIVDIYHDPDTRKIFIATASKIYQLNDDYSTTVIKEGLLNVSKVYYYNDAVHYIIGNEICEVGSQDSFTLENPKIIYSNPLLLYDDTEGKVYSPADGSEIEGLTTTGTIKFTAFDHQNNVIYYVNCVDDEWNLYRITKKSDGTYAPEKLCVVGEIFGLAYYNGTLYLVKKNGNEYYVAKIQAGLFFDKTDYTYSSNINEANLIYTDGSLATDGTYIYSQTSSSISAPQKTLGAINSITKKEYNNNDYYVATGGTKIYVSRVNDNGLSWYSKDIDGSYIKIDENDPNSNKSIPDNIAGCLWFDNTAFGSCFIAYSQTNIYLFGPDTVERIFILPALPKREALRTKDFASFKSWFYTIDESPSQLLKCSHILELGEYGCIITGIRVIDNELYVSLYNPALNSYSNENVIKSGIYKLTVSHPSQEYSIDININTPIYTVGEDNHKIYSFNRINNNLYFTDGKTLFNDTTSSENDLGLDSSDRAINIFNNSNKVRIFTSKAMLDENYASSLGEIVSSVNYRTTNDDFMIASTENILMISDNNYIFSSVDNGEDRIDSELFQVCFKKGVNGYRLIQSNNAVFIVSGNLIKRVPFYDIVSSSNYGCGYVTDTTPHKWYGAAPYYFASNVLNNRKNKLNRELFIKSFTENFKVELEKLLKHIPDAFVDYTRDKLVENLKKMDVDIEGDDGQIADFIINSVASTTAGSVGMYVRSKFMDKIGDDTTYQTFAENVYKACVSDATNNMTKDFYDIFEELYFSIISEALSELHYGPNGISTFLLRYYQNHKAEWAQSMTDLINVDTVDPEWYESVLKDTIKLKQTSYRFNYETGEYEYQAPIYVDKECEQIEGYFDVATNKFYSDPEHQTVIDDRTFDSTDQTWSIDGNVICYKNDDDDKFYSRKLQDYVLTQDTSPVAGTTYYEKTDEEYSYSLTADTEEGNKAYYTPDYTLSEASSPVTGTTYYERTGGESTYEAASLAAGATYLELGTYFEKVDYELTSDTEISVAETTKDIYVHYGDAEPEDSTYERYSVTFAPSASGAYVYIDDGSSTYYSYAPDYVPEVSEDMYDVFSATPDDNGDYYLSTVTESSSDKEYYEQEYVQASGSAQPGIQYYESDFVPTDDEEINPNKVYYEYLNLDDFVGQPYFEEYTAGASGDRYDLVYVAVTSTELDPDETYYVEEDGNYVISESMDEQGGPYYLASFVAASDGDYVQSSFASNQSGFEQVLYPQLNNLSSYYEKVYNKIKTPDSPIAADNIFTLEYVLVENPNNAELPTYYEKTDRYEAASDVNYVYDDEGNEIGIEFDRNYYILKDEPLTYTPKQTLNPRDDGLYEITSYTQIIPGSSLDPHAEGLYVREYSPTMFVQKTPVSNPHDEGLFEYSYEFSNLYDDKKVYIDLGAEEQDSAFPDEDDNWHNSFYESASAAAASVTDKTTAIAALNDLVFPYPSWKWEMLINDSVTTLYIPKQGEQFRTIVMDSNMYPIQWNELPSEIDRNSFDYALTTLLYMIKQRLLTNITILVDGGKVKCYSCIDASTVIKKIVNRNYMVWRNQINAAKNKVNNATTLEEIKAAFIMIPAYDKTLYLLENILNDQSALYAKYIDMIIEEQVINDNETEVTL